MSAGKTLRILNLGTTWWLVKVKDEDLPIRWNEGTDWEQKCSCSHF